MKGGSAAGGPGEWVFHRVRLSKRKHLSVHGKFLLSCENMNSYHSEWLGSKAIRSSEKSGIPWESSWSPASAFWEDFEVLQKSLLLMVSCALDKVIPPRDVSLISRTQQNFLKLGDVLEQFATPIDLLEQNRALVKTVGKCKPTAVIWGPHLHKIIFCMKQELEI